MSYSDFMNTNVDDTKKPPIIPPGDYILSLKSYKGNTSPTGIDFIESTLSVVSAIEGSNDFKGNLINHTFWLGEERDRYRCKRFLCTVLGYDPESSVGRPYAELWENAVGQTVRATVEHKPSKKDPSVVFPTIKSFSKA